MYDWDDNKGINMCLMPVGEWYEKEGFDDNY